MSETPILDLLDKKRIFNVEVLEDGVEFQEGCDNWFTHKLTFEEFDQLIIELTQLRKRS